MASGGVGSTLLHILRAEPRAAPDSTTGILAVHESSRRRTRGRKRPPKAGLRENHNPCGEVCFERLLMQWNVRET